jgi:NAD+ kinase
MKVIGVIANCGKPEARAILQRVRRKAAKLRLQLVAAGATARLLPGATRVTERALPARADAVLALGGDGTMLQAARLVGGTDTPLLGVNIGNLGFLTSVTLDQLERALEVLARDTYDIATRTALSCELHRGRRRLATYRALNDVVVAWDQSSRINTFDVLVDNERVTSYRCDGIIVSTPTGTTGHSLSAGGPIIHPEAPALLLNVICPHTLSTRPLVLNDRSTITIELLEAAGELLLSVDGQVDHPMTRGDRLVVARSPQSVRFIHLPGHSYFGVLRQKLLWRGSSLQPT